MHFNFDSAFLSGERMTDIDSGDVLNKPITFEEYIYITFITIALLNVTQRILQVEGLLHQRLLRFLIAVAVMQLYYPFVLVYLQWSRTKPLYMRRQTESNRTRWNEL